MNDEIAVKVEHVSKKYCKSLKRSMFYGVKDIARNMLGMSSYSGRLRKAEFWGADDISFELKRGEVLGIIGSNGAGKTTMLKMINGIFWPDKGKITVNGRVGALIDVGAGFHPLLTGRENIYLNAAVLGMTKQEVQTKFDSIVDFADIGDFLDTPVKFYSSGMLVRVGFAVAAYCDPEVLLIDEVLAVGDISFRAKCYNRIAELIKNCSVVMVSHDMAAIARISSECIVLKGGKFLFQGPPEEAIQHYLASYGEERPAAQYPMGSGEAVVEGIKIYNAQKTETETLQYGDSMTISFDVKVAPEYKNFIVSITFVNQIMQLVAQCHSDYNNVVLENNGHLKTMQITIPKILFNPGNYSVNVIIFDETNRKILAWYPESKRFKIKGEFVGNADFQLIGSWKTCNHNR